MPPTSTGKRRPCGTAAAGGSQMTALTHAVATQPMPGGPHQVLSAVPTTGAFADTSQLITADSSRNRPRTALEECRLRVQPRR